MIAGVLRDLRTRSIFTQFPRCVNGRLLDAPVERKDEQPFIVTMTNQRLTNDGPRGEAKTALDQI